MRKIFVDTLYWLAIMRPNDPWKSAALLAQARIGGCQFVTSDEVLCEVLSALARGGPALRRMAVEAVRAILDSPDVQVIPQSRETSLSALMRYSQRLDKEYSFVDCASMNAMDAQGIREILTNDRHFSQEGCTALIT